MTMPLLVEKPAVLWPPERVVRQKLTQQDIADRVGSSREMVNRIMKELTVGGYVSVRDDKQLVICKKLPAAW